MFKKVISLIILGFFVLMFTIKAQQVPIKTDSIEKSTFFIDSAKINKISIDTITPNIFRIPDSLSIRLTADSLTKGLRYEIFDLEILIKKYAPLGAVTSTYQPGKLLPKGESWVMAVIGFLIILFAVLKFTFAKQLMSIMQSFFSNRALVNLNKEDNLFTSWPFLLLFIQFGFIIGMFFYLMAHYRQIDNADKGFQFYLTISILIIGLYVFKIIVLRLLGYLFNVQKPVNEYVSILYLSYFNASLLFMPLVIAFALSPLKYGTFYIAMAGVLLVIIFVFQFIRAGINILSHYRFSKVYLFLYFCTLEICPILILIKAIGF
jgi:hypothetical protein